MFDERQATSPAAIAILKILDAGGYKGPSGEWVSLRGCQDAAERGVRLYTPGTLARLRATPSAGNGRPKIEVVDSTTQAAAMRLANDCSIALLNFASARNPGG